jgi:hypothetical protein
MKDPIQPCAKKAQNSQAEKMAKNKIIEVIDSF